MVIGFHTLKRQWIIKNIQIPQNKFSIESSSILMMYNDGFLCIFSDPAKIFFIK